MISILNSRTYQWTRLTLALFALATGAPIALAQEYPTKPIKVIMPFAAGTGLDVLAREFFEQLSPRLGQPIIVDNKPGASLTLGTALAAKAPSDGYTLVIGTMSSMVLTVGTFAKLPYDPVKDFAPISLFYKTPLFLTTSTKLPFQTAQEFVAYGKANPGKPTFGSIGPGSTNHMFGELFASVNQIAMLHIPYKDTYAIDLIAGRLDSVFDPGSTAIPRIQKGQIRALAITGTKRLTATPDVPTMTEAGVPGFDDAVAWVGFFAPAGTPLAIVNKLSHEINETLKTSPVVEKYRPQGMDFQASTPAELERTLKIDLPRWGALQKKIGM